MNDIVEQLRHRAEWDIIASSSFDTQMCIDAADEIERLRNLITEWADADDDWTDVSAEDGPERSAYAAAHDALRRAVGK